MEFCNNKYGYLASSDMVKDRLLQCAFGDMTVLPCVLVRVPRGGDQPLL